MIRYTIKVVHHRLLHDIRVTYSSQALQTTLTCGEEKATITSLVRSIHWLSNVFLKATRQCDCGRHA